MPKLPGAMPLPGMAMTGMPGSGDVDGTPKRPQTLILLALTDSTWQKHLVAQLHVLVIPLQDGRCAVCFQA